MFSFQSKEKIYIADALRTPIGITNRSLSSFSAAKIGSVLLKEMLRLNKLSSDDIDEAIIGNVVSAGCGQNLARQIIIQSGLNVNTPGFVVNNVCGASLQAVILGANSLYENNDQIIVAGGSESATHCPFLLTRHDLEEKNIKNAIDSMKHDGLFCLNTNQSMGLLVEELAKKYKISRKAQDEYSLKSHLKVIDSQEKGYFEKECVEVELSPGKVLRKDDKPRKNIKIKSFEALPLAFKKKGGTVTAGNTSSPCDGAAMVLLTTRKVLQKKKLKPKAKIVGFVTVTVDPAKAFEASVLAVKECLKKFKFQNKDIDLFEVSEAFAVQALFTQKKLKVAMSKWNVLGGDLALGHPLGAARTRSLVTLINALHIKGLKRGLVSIPYGGGGAIAMIVEAL